MGKAHVTLPENQPLILIEREFDVPREKVFAAFVDKDKLEKWWIGPGTDIQIETQEAHNGGRWRYVQSKDGQEYIFHGSFHEVTAPERIIWTFEFEPLPLPTKGHVSMEKIEFTELDGNRTRINIVSTFFCVEDRDGMAQSGMEDGMNQSYDALEKLLAE